MGQGRVDGLVGGRGVSWLGGSDEGRDSWASGPCGCMASEVLTERDMAMSWVPKAEGDRAGVERRFQCRLAACVNGVGLRDMQCMARTPGVDAFSRQSSRRWARVAAQVWGHSMKAVELSAVGVLLPLLLPLTLEAFVRPLAPFQLRFASRATRRQTPWGGMQLLPMRNGVTLGSWRYSTYVDHK